MVVDDTVDPEMWRLVRREIERAFGQPHSVLSTHGHGVVEEEMVYPESPPAPIAPAPALSSSPSRMTFWQRALLVPLFAYLWHLWLD